MTENPSTRRTTTRPLVDPDLAEFVDMLQPLELAAATLPAFREAMSQPPVGLDEGSAAVRLTSTELRIPRSGSADGLRLRVHTPEVREARTPAILWMHGGGMIAGTAERSDPLCRHLARATGATVFAVDYRLAPETVAPGAVEDGYTALAWVHENASDLAIDGDRVAIGGQSAGGGISAALGLMARDQGDFPVACEALVYPMLDDRTVVAEPNPTTGEFLWTRDSNRFAWTSWLAAKPGSTDVSAYAAPARATSLAHLPPSFLCVGSLDLFLDECMAYANRLLRSGVPTELHVYPGAIHGFDAVGTARVTARFLRDLSTFLRRHLTDRQLA